MRPFEIRGKYWNLDQLVFFKESVYYALTPEGEERAKRFGDHAVRDQSGGLSRLYRRKRPQVVLHFPEEKWVAIQNVTAESFLRHLGKGVADSEKNVPPAPDDWKPPEDDDD